jgi:hypothetical protein
MPEHGYIGGHPDKEPIYVRIEVSDSNEKVVFPVSRYLRMSVFKSWIVGKLGLSIRDYDLSDSKGEKIVASETFHSLGCDNGFVIRLVKNDSSKLGGARKVMYVDTKCRGDIED